MTFPGFQDALLPDNFKFFKPPGILYILKNEKNPEGQPLKMNNEGLSTGDSLI